jgi:hypothetical protein
MQMQNSDEKNTNGADGLKQQSFEGMGFPEVEAAALKLRNHRAKRMEMQVEEQKLADALVSLMGTREISVFKFEEDGKKFVAKIKHGKTKVSVVADSGDENGDE